MNSFVFQETQMYDSSTCEVGTRNALIPEPTLTPSYQDRFGYKEKSWLIARMLARYVHTAFSLRSSIEQLVVDPSRIARKQFGIDLDASRVEQLDQMMAAMIRHAVTALPALRTERPSSVVADADIKRNSLRCVASRRDVAPILRVKSSRHCSANPGAIRIWRATIARKFSLIERDQATVLLRAAVLRDELVEIGNKLEGARRDVERLRHGVARRLRRIAEQRCSHLRSEETEKLDELRGIERSNIYADGVENLFRVCTVSREVESYCFGEDR